MAIRVRVRESAINSISNDPSIPWDLAVKPMSVGDVKL